MDDRSARLISRRWLVQGRRAIDRLILQRKRLPWHREEPGLGLLICAFGERPIAVRVAALEAGSQGEARLLLADPLEVDLPPGTPVIPPHSARLDQDRV